MRTRDEIEEFLDRELAEPEGERQQGISDALNWALNAMDALPL